MITFPADFACCFCYSAHMKGLLKVLLLALFAIVVFMPMNRLSQWLYWSLFALMFLILLLYYLLSYWVSVSAVPCDDIRFTAFAGKIPPMASEDLVRGRLVVGADRLCLYQRVPRQVDASRVKEVWSIGIDQVDSFSIGRVIGLRNGLILSLSDGDEARFAIFSMKRKKEAFSRSLGWGEEASMN